MGNKVNDLRPNNDEKQMMLNVNVTTGWRVKERTDEDGEPIEVEQENVSEPDTEVRAWSELDGRAKEATFQF